ncbi:MAG: polysaccharide deacetylase family protein [Fuerstiella sp.]
MSDPAQQTQTDNVFRVVIMSGAPPRVLARLLTEICRHDSRRVTGVLYWVQKPLPLNKRVRNFVSQLHKPAYLRYVADRLVSTVAGQCRRLGHFLARVAHAGFPDTADFGVAELEEHCRQLGIPFQTTDQFHSEQSLAFVSAGQPDLGIVYGTPILKPKLFQIPRHGSVNLHQRKVPDYRGGGPIGLWELLDGAQEIGVTVHRVAAKLDSGAIIRAVEIPIQPFDTLVSLEAKAHVTGIDLLVATVDDFAMGTVTEVPQTGSGRMFRNPKPEDLPELKRQIRLLRGPQPAERTYPRWKLLVRCLLFGPFLVARNWYRRLTGTFPIVILYHHVITDRPHFMGMSTDRFLSQMQYLRRYYNIVDLKTAQRLLQSGRVSEPTIVLTFDDGYRDNVLNLRAAALDGDVPATLYICSEQLELGRPFAHDLQHGCRGFAPMTWDEVRKMEAWGFDFGAHTRTHFDCGSTDEEMLLQEIIECRREIEEQVGHDIQDFSFPLGLPPNISRPAFDIAARNYSTVASAYGGVNRCGQPGTHHLYRVPHLSSLLEVELQLQSALVLGQPVYWTGGEGSSKQPGRHRVGEPELVDV